MIVFVDYVLCRFLCLIDLFCINDLFINFIDKNVGFYSYEKI